MTSTPSAQSQTDQSAINGDLTPPCASSHPVRQCLQWLLQRPLVRLGVASAVATAVNYGTFYLILQLLPNRPLFVSASVAIGYITGIFVNFYLSRLLLFGASQYHIGVEFAMVTIINLIGLVLTEATTLVLITRWQFNPKLAYALALVISFLWNAYARMFLIYRHKPAAPESE
ncbi:MAG: GtrA family protein [Armatimonadota bacterium]